jgi:hypothetical protein
MTSDQKIEDLFTRVVRNKSFTDALLAQARAVETVFNKLSGVEGLPPEAKAVLSGYLDELAKELRKIPPDGH